MLGLGKSGSPLVCLGIRMFLCFMGRLPLLQFQRTEIAPDQKQRYITRYQQVRRRLQSCAGVSAWSYGNSSWLMVLSLYCSVVHF